MPLAWWNLGRSPRMSKFDRETAAVVPLLSTGALRLPTTDDPTTSPADRSGGAGYRRPGGALGRWLPRHRRRRRGTAAARRGGHPLRRLREYRAGLRRHQRRPPAADEHAG